MRTRDRRQRPTAKQYQAAVRQAKPRKIRDQRRRESPFNIVSSCEAKRRVKLALGGMPAVLIAALIVRSLPLTYVRWLVVVVVLYAAVTLLRASVTESRSAEAA
jgi:hypothetical protein